jgi:hypothetical protein
MGVELSCHENTNVRRLYSQLVSSRRLDIDKRSCKVRTHVPNTISKMYKNGDLKAAHLQFYGIGKSGINRRSRGFI